MNRSIAFLLLLLAPFALWAQSKAAQERQKLDVNKALQAELEALPGIGPERARWIAETRKRNGPFRCVTELRAMPRLSDRQFAALQPLVFVANPDPRCEPNSGAMN